MTIGEIIKSIVDYGSTPVLLALIIFLVIWFIKGQRDSNKKQQELNATQQELNAKQEERMAKQEERMTEILQEAKDIRENTLKIHTNREEEENRRCNILVNTQLNCLLSKTGANRVSCFLYHNGGYTVTGRSFQKMSMLYEAVDLKTLSVMSSYQNVPRTMFPILMQKLSEQGYYDIDDIEQIKETDAITYQTFLARGAKAAYIGVLKDSRRNTLGFVVVEYIADECKDKELLKNLIKIKINRISAAIEVNPDAPQIKGRTNND